MLNNAFPIEGRGSAMNDYTMVLVIFSAMILKNEPLLWMIIARQYYVYDYTMVLVIFSAMFLKNEPLGITMNDYSQAVLWMIIQWFLLFLAQCF